VEIACQSCGTRFHGRRDAKFCGATCRKRGSRVGVVVAAGVEAVPESPPHPLVDAIRRQLEAAGRADIPAAQAALLLAERMHAGRDTGSALASMSRELSARLAEALAGAVLEADALDELAARRAKKAAGA
jgi:hypothetical protein